MPAFKCVHFFRDSQTALGWSEVWYMNATDFNAASTQGILIAKARAKLLAISNLIEYQRITGNLRTTDVNPVPVRNQRLATLEKISEIGSAGGTVKVPGDWTTTAVKVRWTSADFTRFRTQLLRGIPDDWFAADDHVGKANVAAWIPVMLKALFAGGAQIRYLPPKQNPPVTRTYAYIAPTQADYTGYTRRATGRPFAQPRGRRPNRT